jgi:hypothetical protein
VAPEEKNLALVTAKGSGLPPGPLALLHELLFGVAPKGSSSGQATQAVLAARLGCSPKTIGRYTKALEADRRIAVVRSPTRRINGRNWRPPNRYRIFTVKERRALLSQGDKLTCPVPEESRLTFRTAARAWRSGRPQPPIRTVAEQLAALQEGAMNKGETQRPGPICAACGRFGRLRPLYGGAAAATS